MLAKAMATALMMSNTPVQCAIASKPTPINNQSTLISRWYKKLFHMTFKILDGSFNFFGRKH